MRKFFFSLVSYLLLVSAIHAQIPLPYVESFDSYTANQPLNGHGGIAASSHVYVTPYGVSGNCGEFQMTDTALVSSDTIVSPVIGPLTAHTATSFYFRAVTFSGGVPSVYHMTYTDKVNIYVGINNFFLTLLQYTIDSSNQNTTTGYVKVTVAAPAQVNTYSGQFKVIAFNPGGNNWRLEFDSLVVRDTVPVYPVLRDSVTNVGCRSQSTGGIKVIPSAATPPYTYLWSPGGDTTQSIIDKPAGVYTVTVTDHLGVSVSLTDTIREPALALILDSLSKTPALCYGSNTGSAQIYASGGTTPYSYVWSNSPASHADSVTDLTSGNYDVTVTDGGGCIITATVHISQPSNALVTTTQSTQSTLGNNGTATVNASGGTGTIHYAWSTNPVQTTAIVTGLAPGLYEVTVSDGTGCVIVDTVFVDFPAGISELSNHSVFIYPNPATDRVHVDIKGLNNAELSISVIDLSGRVVIAEESAAKLLNTSSLANGVYIIKLSMEGDFYMSRLVIER